MGLEVRRWLREGTPIYSVALADKAQYFVVGSEKGVAVFDARGKRVLHYPQEDLVPARRVAVSCDFGHLYAVFRQSALVKLELTEKGEGLVARPSLLFHSEKDIHSMAFSDDGEVIAIGHFSPGLTVINTEGEILWRRHPENENPTEGKVWSVALSPDGKTLYVGSANSGTNRLAALDSKTGHPIAFHYIKSPVTSLVSVPSIGCVAVGFMDNEEGIEVARLRLYTGDLSEQLWEITFDEPITSLGVDREKPLLAVGVGYEGAIYFLDAESGKSKTEPIKLKTIINDLDITGGKIIAAGTQDGNFALIYYVPEEFVL